MFLQMRDRKFTFLRSKIETSQVTLFWFECKQLRTRLTFRSCYYWAVIYWFERAFFINFKIMRVGVKPPLWSNISSLPPLNCIFRFLLNHLKLTLKITNAKLTRISKNCMVSILNRFMSEPWAWAMRVGVRIIVYGCLKRFVYRPQGIKRSDVTVKQN